MADVNMEEDNFFDAFSSFADDNSLLNFFGQDTLLLKDALDGIMDSEWSNDSGSPQLPDPSSQDDFQLTDYILRDDPVTTFVKYLPSENCSGGLESLVVSKDHDHTYSQRSPVVSKTMVYRDGTVSLKKTAPRRQEQEIMDSLGQIELTRVTADESPLVLPQDDIGYNSMSENGSPRSITTAATGTYSVPSIDTISESDEGSPSPLAGRGSEVPPPGLQLSWAEKEVLLSEGLPVPTCMPLTSAEKKALQAVRRRLKAKASAKENRRKRKDYVFQLEEEVRRANARSSSLQKKVDSLSDENTMLTVQVQTMQSLLTKCAHCATAAAAKGSQSAVAVGTCLSVVVLCFALLAVNLAPSLPTGLVGTQGSTGGGSWGPSGTLKARALLSIEYPSGYNSWLPFQWSLEGREKCSELLSVLLTLRFPKPYSLFDMYIDPHGQESTVSPLHD